MNVRWRRGATCPEAPADHRVGKRMEGRLLQPWSVGGRVMEDAPDDCE